MGLQILHLSYKAIIKKLLHILLFPFRSLYLPGNIFYLGAEVTLAFCQHIVGHISLAVDQRCGCIISLLQVAESLGCNLNIFQKVFPLNPGNNLPFMHILAIAEEYIPYCSPIVIGDTHELGGINEKTGAVNFLGNPAEYAPDYCGNQEDTKSHQTYPAMMVDYCDGLIKLFW